MAATIDEIDEAIYAALGGLTRAGGGGPMVALDRYAGQVTRAQGVDRATLGRAPALLLACPGGDPVANEGVSTLLEGTIAVVDRLVWLVYVIVAAPQGDTQAVKPRGGLPGLYALVSAVQLALHGLPIDGLFQDQNVCYAGWRWHEATVPGAQYVAVVRFTTDVEIDAMDPEASLATWPLEITGAVHNLGEIEPQDPASDVGFDVTP